MWSFCKYGTELPSGERVTLIPVDALAYFYNSINAKKNDENRKDYKCYFGLFEFMANSWESEFADLIIISNALDHCIDPFRSIIECLYVLRTNGVIRLIHARAEGLYENWEGLHKWNIDIINGEVVIWNKENAVNISNELKEVAEIEISTYWEEEDSFKREYIIADIIKKNNIEIEEWIDIKNDSKYMMHLAENIMNNWANDSVELKNYLGKIQMN